MFRYVQGFETVRNNVDLVAQGWASPYTGSTLVPIASNVLSTLSEQIRCEQYQSGTTDLSPNFAGTSIQCNTGATINSLWTAGGFVFGGRGQLRDTTAPFTIGDVATDDTASGVGNQSTNARIDFDGTLYWSLRKIIATNVVTVCSSPDLVTWTDTVAHPTTNAKSITCANGLLIVTQQNNTVSFSSDHGATWTATIVFNPGPGVTAGNLMSNVVYWNSKYYVSVVGNPASNAVLYKSTDLVTWTQVASNAVLTGGVWAAALQIDSIRNVLYWSYMTGLANAQTFARLNSVSTAEVVTGVWTPTTLNGRVGVQSVAIGTDRIVCSMSDGSVYYSIITSGVYGTFTAATTGITNVGLSARQSVVYDPRSAQFVIVSSGGVQVLSTDGITWALSHPIQTTKYNVGSVYLNSLVIITGQSVAVGSGGVLSGVSSYGWDTHQWSETAVASGASTTAQGSGRLGFAAINSTSRSSFVGIYATTAINTGTSTAQFGFSSNNTTTGADTPSETYSIAIANKFPYFELICTATATVNQFSIQVMINGTVVSATPFVVALCGTTDVTSTLYVTVPIRNQAVSTLPTLIAFDDMYVLDFSGSQNNSVMRGINIIKAPFSNDDQAQWTKNPASIASNHLAASASSVSVAGSSLTSNIAGNKDIYTAIQPFDISMFSVKAVQVEGTLSNTTLAATSAKLGLSSSGVAVDSGVVSLATGINSYVAKLQETDPNTGVAWSRAAAIAAKSTLEKVS